MTARFLASHEQEWLTIIEGCSRNNEEMRFEGIRQLYEEIGRIVPTLQGWRSGIHTYLGRLYLDTGYRLEAALCEYDSPYDLAIGSEQMQDLVAAATKSLAAKGTRMTFVANNVSGVLTNDNYNTSGCHENYLVLQHPSTFGDMLLAYLATRPLYSGSGNFVHPSGDYIACTRAFFTRVAQGGSTTDVRNRALHSLARDENHVGGKAGLFRYHQISGDALRSHRWGIALRAGSMLLAIAAVHHDPTVGEKANTLKGPGSWIDVLKESNTLRHGAAGKLRVPRRTVQIQRIYLDGARRYADSLGDRMPDWIPRVLDDWQAVLDACERKDYDWLSMRLDCFIKHRLLDGVLGEMNESWTKLSKSRYLASELTLIGQRYHEFSNPEADLFRQLEEAGAIDHRVHPRRAPGSEPDPCVLDHVRTRARPRSRFIKHAPECNRDTIRMDWSQVFDREQMRRRALHDPFAEEYADWQSFGRRGRGREEILEDIPF